MKFHPYHLVDQRPWPIILSTGLLTIVLGFIKLFNFFSIELLLFGIILSLFCSLRWTNDINDERNLGSHSETTRKGFVIGFAIFIMREILLFLGFFWSFFTNSLVPIIEIGVMWPPKSLLNPSPLGASTAGTALLLTSGAFLTSSHHNLIQNTKVSGSYLSGVLYCIILGELFVVIQASEYSMNPFAISDSSLGCCFFMLTGLHGLHVLVGLSLLWLSYIRLFYTDVTRNKHVGFETAAWYWHFVDIVWLFVFRIIYAWRRHEEISFRNYLFFG